jgi:hypothetical protein
MYATYGLNVTSAQQGFFGEVMVFKVIVFVFFAALIAIGLWLDKHLRRHNLQKISTRIDELFLAHIIESDDAALSFNPKTARLIHENMMSRRGGLFAESVRLYKNETGVYYAYICVSNEDRGYLKRLDLQEAKNMLLLHKAKYLEEFGNSIGTG